MNETIVRESLQRLRDQKRQNDDIIRDSMRSNANLQTKLDRISQQYDREECQGRKMQEGVRLSVNQLFCISEDVKKMIEVIETMKAHLDQLDHEDEELVTYNKQDMNMWEEECLEHAQEFQRAFKLYLNQPMVQEDHERLQERYDQVESIIDQLEGKERQLINCNSDNSDTSTVEDISSFLLQNPTGVQILQAYHVDGKKNETLRVRLEDLKQIES